MRGARDTGRAVNERWHMRKDGSRFWGSGVMLPVEFGKQSSGYLKIFRDRTSEVKAEERRALLINELNHRVKNTLATVQSFAAQTLRSAKTIPEAREAFEARLLALAKAHNILTDELWEGADLRDVVAEATAAYRDGAAPPRFHIEGPNVRLQPKAVLALSMALHELATNAVKYGALSNGTGGVEISWDVDRNNPQRFHFRWTEKDGRPVPAPRRRGFGSRLVEQGLPQDLAGAARLCFAREGLVYTIEAPLEEVSGGKP